MSEAYEFGIKYKVNEPHLLHSMLGAHTFVSNRSALDWHVQVERVTATISCLIGEHDSGILLTDRIASLAKKISMRGLFPPSAVLAELSSEAQSRVARGDTVESVETWLDSLIS